jgi:regulator of sigma E protease
VSVTPVQAEGERVGRIGIAIAKAQVVTQFGVIGGIAHGARMTVGILGQMASALGRIVAQFKVEEVSGPVLIAQISNQKAEEGPTQFLFFLAILSLNLGLINLLPIPALDGGRLLFIAFEALRGRRVEPAREQLVHLVGFFMVIGLMLLLTVRELYAVVQ